MVQLGRCRSLASPWISMSTQTQFGVLALPIEEDSKRWHSLFSHRLTEIDGFTHQTRLDAQASSVVQRSLAIRDGLSQEARHLKTQGIIEPTDSSPCISILVVVRKKSGAIRLRADLRAVNKAEKYPYQQCTHGRSSQSLL